MFVLAFSVFFFSEVQNYVSLVVSMFSSVLVTILFLLRKVSSLCLSVLKALPFTV